MKQQFGVSKKMETMIVDKCIYRLVEYAYVTVSSKDYVGRHKSPDLKIAGELNKEIGDDCEWLTPSTPIERAPLGDTFMMEGIEGEANLTRHELLQQLEEEKWLKAVGSNQVGRLFLNPPDDGRLTTSRNYRLVVVGSHNFTPQEEI
jgi:hypothetical protein